MSDIATVAQMRVIDFEPIPEFRAASKGERIDRADKICTHLRAAAVITSEVLSRTKPELIALIATDRDANSEMLNLLSDAKKDADVLSELIDAATVRLMVACSSIATDEEAKYIDDDGAQS